jgi:glutamate-1-semialdehyde 2,1-aminomutase
MLEISANTRQSLINIERARFIASHPNSETLAAQAASHWLFGVPLHWMSDWSTPFALQVASAQGACVTDVDGHDYADFCLGDTGAMFGHTPAAVVNAVQQQVALGCTAMLSGADAAWVGAELARRFALPVWQSALSASDANRFLLRWVRAATGRNKLLVFNGCYHGTVDDVFVDLVDGQQRQRRSLLGQVFDLTTHTQVLEFNDLPALAAALAAGDVACVLAEPVMTNVGMVLPQPDFWSQAQALIRQHGALLILDETHTFSSGPGGYAKAHGLHRRQPRRCSAPAAILVARLSPPVSSATRASRKRRDSLPPMPCCAASCSACAIAASMARAAWRRPRAPGWPPPGRRAGPCPFGVHGRAICNASSSR